MEGSRVGTLVLRDARWGYLLTLQVFVPRRASGGDDVPETFSRVANHELVVTGLKLSQRGTVTSQGWCWLEGVTCGAACTFFFIISHSSVFISGRDHLCSSGHTEVCLLAVKHSSVSWGRRWPLLFLCSWRIKGQILPMEEREPRPRHVAFVEPEALLLQVSLMYFLGWGRDLKLLFVPFHMFGFPRGTSFNGGDSFPDTMVLTEGGAGLLRRLAHKGSTAAFAGPCRPTGSGWALGSPREEDRHKHRGSTHRWYPGEISKPTMGCRMDLTCSGSVGCWWQCWLRLLCMFCPWSSCRKSSKVNKKALNYLVRLMNRKWTKKVCYYQSSKSIKDRSWLLVTPVGQM